MQAVNRRVRPLFGSELEDDVQESARSPCAVHRRRRLGSLVGAECDLEAEEPTDERHEILQRAMALFAHRSLTLFDQRSRRGDVGDVLEEKPPKALARCIEPRGRIEATDERQQVAEGDVHGARASTIVPDGSGAPGVDSIVTRTPVTGRGTLGGESVAVVARPDSSGVKVPALTAGPLRVINQI